MTNELVDALVRMNLAAGAAILVVLLLRRPVRAFFGARVAYALWAIAPIAALASLVPARHVEHSTASAEPSAWQRLLEAVSSFIAGVGPLSLVAVWFAGVCIALGALAWRQHRFIARLGKLDADAETPGLYRCQRANTGPALVGAIAPRIVAPADFDTRFDADERTLILAHERTHLDAGDAQINALAALFTCVFWFNPLVHLAAFRLRLDQELACDADVVAAYPLEKRRYAETLLKTQLASHAVPIGCAWPPRAAHPLRERIAMLCERAPSLRSPAMGMTMLALLSMGAGAAAWAAQPPVIDAAPVEVCEDAGDYYVVASAEGGYATVAAQDMTWTSPTLVVMVDRQAGLEARKQDQADAMQLADTGKPKRYVVND